MDSKLIVRPVEPDDRARWEPLWRGYNAFYGRPEFSHEITEVTWSRFFDANERMHALVAERDAQILGLVHFLFHRSTTSIELTCYLQDLFTAEAARGQGVGRALIEAVYEEATKAGSTRVYWQTHETNLTAMRLYDLVAERSGFIVFRKLL
jgi:GNAT superfamily N-acetyltransferase